MPIVDHPKGSRIDRVGVGPAQRHNTHLYLETRRSYEPDFTKRPPILLADDASREQERPHVRIDVCGAISEYNDVDVGVHPSSVSHPRADNDNAPHILVLARPPDDLAHDGLNFSSSLLCHHTASLTCRPARHPSDDRRTPPIDTDHA